jgi:hypothetical protein
MREPTAMSAKNLSGDRMAETGSRRRGALLPALSLLVQPHVDLILVIGAMVLLVISGGCMTDYQKRVNALTEAYERGDLSREDYTRFVYDAKAWHHER